MSFADVERFAKHFDDPARDAWQRPAEVVELMHISTGQTVADVGAGTGYFLPHLAKAVGPKGSVLALDVEPNMVRYMQQRVEKAGIDNVQVKQVPPDDPGLGQASVDRVLIVNTWHHISDRSNYAGKLARALRPGGAVFIVDFTKESDIGPPLKHRLSTAQVVEELRLGGLSADVAAEHLPKQYVVRGKK